MLVNGGDREINRTRIPLCVDDIQSVTLFTAVSIVFPSCRRIEKHNRLIVVAESCDYSGIEELVIINGCR